MTRRTIGSARYGLIFPNGQIEVIYAVALIQALGYCAEKPRRVFVFESDRALCVDSETLEKCWTRTRNY